MFRLKIRKETKLFTNVQVAKRIATTMRMCMEELRMMGNIKALGTKTNIWLSSNSNSRVQFKVSGAFHVSLKMSRNGHHFRDEDISQSTITTQLKKHSIFTDKKVTQKGKYEIKNSEKNVLDVKRESSLRIMT
ncbi:CLUMA_CG003706, isoform A [Clunio marinus]|uniref:CLUMA_CG003706, isoform A n=1 Tax=Clunio marinus TaxID=568069 RepID=A0A1J1HPT7_9DIPT|nr:CLUMA_CG003706, isoform A [Clunio marinus]